MVYDSYIMIRKTVYFRTQEDLDKFNAIKNKAEWFHGILNDSWIMEALKYVQRAEFKPEMIIDSSYAKPDIPTVTIKSMGKNVDIIAPEYISKKFSARKKK